MQTDNLNELIINWIRGDSYIFPHENMEFVRGAGDSQVGPDKVRYEFLIIIDRERVKETRIYMSDDALEDAINYCNVEGIQYNNTKLELLINEIKSINEQKIGGNLKLVVDDERFHFVEIGKQSR